MQVSAPLVNTSCSSCATAYSAANSENTQNNRLNDNPKQILEKAEKSSSATLSESEKKQLQDLKQRDREVRVHEAAHLSAAGNLALNGATFTYQIGPDGVQYAIGGEVRIDTSAVPGDPEATLQKAQQIRSAALAPAQPSQQDIAVAAKASQLAIEARAEINQKNPTDNLQNSPLTTNQNSDSEEIVPSIRDKQEQYSSISSSINSYKVNEQQNQALIDLVV